MIDLANKGGIIINTDLLAKKLGVPVMQVSARKLEGIKELKDAISFANKFALQQDSIDINALAPELLSAISREIKTDNPYFALQLAHQHETLKFLSLPKATA
jgi:ferrous iron transport protein B